MVKPLKIGLLMQASSEWMGGVIYVQNLVKALALLNHKEGVSIYLIAASNTDPKFYQNLKPLVKKIIVEKEIDLNIKNKIRWRMAAILPFFKNSKLSRIIEQEGLDFLYPITSYEIFLNLPCQWSAWIPDFQHKHLPEYFSKKAIKSRIFLYSAFAKKAQSIIFSSNAALKDFHEFNYQGNNKNFVLNFCTVLDETWYDYDPILIQKKYQLPDQFFLVSNQLWKHKNHKLMIEAIHSLKEEFYNLTVVCTGLLEDSRFPKYKNEIFNLLNQYKLENNILFLGVIPRLDQIQLMRRSLAVIQPSLFEGWSTVVEDARSLGKKLLLSDISVHLEQNPPEATFFSKNSAEDLAAQIKTLLPYLRPGPDRKAEAQAREISKVQCQVYAEKFLEIARDLINS